jgi:dihydroxyacetone kinase-like protein
LGVSYDDAVAFVRAYASVIAEHKDELTALDSAIGDADHGINMNRGMQAALEVVNGSSDADGGNGDIGAMFKAIGMKLVSTVGGAGGPLYGTLFLQLGMKSAGKAKLEAADWVEMLAAAVDGVIARGKAELEDKTMVDALVPARDELRTALDGGASFGDALRRSADGAKRGMEATVPLVARKGRASYLGERSAGHQDPGATSSYLMLQTIADTWGDENR